MNILHKYRYRILILIVLTLVLGTASYGFAAGNTVPAGVAGEGMGVISGYTVSSVTYLLDSSLPTQFDSVAFTLSANASDVYVGIGNGVTTYWTGCAGGPTNFTCDISGSTVSVAAAIELHVSSVQ